MGREPRVDRSPEEKWQILQEGIQSGNVSETCRRYGIAQTLYYRWKDEAEQGAKAALGVRRCTTAGRMKRSREPRQRLGGEALPRRKPRRIGASGNWNGRWGGNRWRSRS